MTVYHGTHGKPPLKSHAYFRFVETMTLSPASPTGSSRLFDQPPSPSHGRGIQATTPVAAPAQPAPHRHMLQQRPTAQMLSTRSDMQGAGKKRACSPEKEASPSNHPLAKRQKTGSPGLRSASPGQAEEEKRFREEVESHCAELLRRDSDGVSSPHSRLSSAIVAMLEFDAPALKEAVISTIGNPDPQKAVSLDQFFATHLGDGATVTPFDDILETMDATYRDVVGAPSAERLIKDVQTFHALIEACQASPHEEIRAAPSSYIVKAAAAFVRHAVAVTPEEQVPDAGKLQRALAYLKEHPDTYTALGVLGYACKGHFSAGIRMAFHTLGLGIAASLPSSRKKSDSIVRKLVATVPRLPVEHQLRAFRNCVSLDTDAPVDAARELFLRCVGLLPKFNHEVGGKAAIELIKTAGQYGDPEALASVMCAIENHLIRRNPYSNAGRSYFDSVSEDDRIEYFVSAMLAAFDMPGFERPVDMGFQIVDRVLPDRMIGLAQDALLRAEQGENIDFRSEAQRW